MNILFWLAILPSALLAYHVLKYDKIEKEPVSLLVRLFVLGMVSCIPSGILEMIGDVIVSAISFTEGMYSALMFLIVVPLAEEFCKYFMLRTTRNNPSFNYTFDGIVYGVMVGLGFATLENIMYVLGDGTIMTAVLRGVLSVPVHCTCGVFMGYYYGVAKGLEVQGLSDRASFARKLAIGIPWAIHGFFDYALDTESIIFLLLGLGVTIAVFILAYRQVRFASEHDTPIVANLSVPNAADMPDRREFNNWSNKGGTPPPPMEY